MRKAILLIVLGVFGIALGAFASSTEWMSLGDYKELFSRAENMHAQDIEAIILADHDKRIRFLVGIVEDEKSSYDEKYVAIRVLGDFRSPVAVEALGKHILFFDERDRSYPAASALVKIGRPALPFVISIIEDSDDERAVGQAAFVLSNIIEGSAYSYLKSRGRVNGAKKLEGKYELD